MFESLRLDRNAAGALASLSTEEWRHVLAFCDRAQITLLLVHAGEREMPAWVADRVRANHAANRERLGRVRSEYFAVAEALGRHGIPHVVLKGLSLYPDFAPSPDSRVQYDLDLAFSPEDVRRARDVLLALGYVGMAELERFPTDHLPVMIRKTGWEWRGDFFDPDIPVPVDLHYRFWDQGWERIAAPGIDAFWERRSGTALHPADALGYCSLHMLRHLLRGSLKPLHVYDLAYFLNSTTEDAKFWTEWKRLHADGLRRLEGVSFRLAESWFGCRMAAEAREAAYSVGPDVDAWFEHYAVAPVEALFTPNKRELWLHMGLAQQWTDRAIILRRKLLPLRLPGPVDGVYLPDESLSARVRLRKAARYSVHLARRFCFHATAIPGVIRDGIGWWWNRQSSGFAWLLASSALMNLGMFVFVVLYNLYLLDLGWNASGIGWISGASTAGSVAGALPASALANRYGLRATLAGAIAGLAAVSLLRATFTGVPALVCLAFLSGLALAAWAVSLAPAVASLVPEAKRTRAFSMLFSSAIAVGVLGGWMAGRLPRWLGHAMASGSAIDLKRAALLVGCAVAATALLPLSRLHLHAPVRTRAEYPHGNFILLFLAGFGIWNLATGSFNPFFNVYLAERIHSSPESIGNVFAAGQLSQVLALLLAPIVFRRLGRARGISAMMSATAVCLLVLSRTSTTSAAAVAYTSYMAFQWMSEPGINALLMSRVKSEERSGASSLYYLVAFSAQAVAAAFAGASMARLGYGPVLMAAAILALVAGVMFRSLRSREQRARSDEVAQSLPESAAESAPR